MSTRISSDSTDELQNKSGDCNKFTDATNSIRLNNFGDISALRGLNGYRKCTRTFTPSFQFFDILPWENVPVIIIQELSMYLKYGLE